MTLKMDLSGVEAWEAGDILPPGRHTVKVTEAKETQSSNGHPQLELSLESIAGEYQGGTIRDWITFTANAAGRVKQVLGALGVDVSGSVEVEPSALVGSRATIVVRTKTRDGKEFSEVKAYEAASGEPAAASNGNGNGAGASDEDDLPF